MNSITIVFPLPHQRLDKNKNWHLSCLTSHRVNKCQSSWYFLFNCFSCLKLLQFKKNEKKKKKKTKNCKFFKAQHLSTSAKKIPENAVGGGGLIVYVCLHQIKCLTYKSVYKSVISFWQGSHAKFIIAFCFFWGDMHWRNSKNLGFRKIFWQILELSWLNEI